MSALIVLVVCLVILVGIIANEAMMAAQAARERRQAALLEQLRIQHEQFIAERHMQRVVSDSLGRMLDEARQRRE